MITNIWEQRDKYQKQLLLHENFNFKQTNKTRTLKIQSHPLHNNGYKPHVLYIHPCNLFPFKVISIPHSILNNNAFDETLCVSDLNWYGKGGVPSEKQYFPKIIWYIY